MSQIDGLNIKSKTDIGLLGDHRSLNNLKSLAVGTKAEQAQALKTVAAQFESLLMQYWMNAMKETNSNINPDSPLHSKYSGFYEDMLAEQQVGSVVNGSGGLNKNSITYLITKQFAKSLGDDGEELLKELEKGMSGGPMPSHEVSLKGSTLANVKNAVFSAGSLIKAAQNEESLKKFYDSIPTVQDIRNFESQEDFVQKLMPYAKKAVEGMSMNPLVLLAQAALETGWGKHVPANNNFYGIKAGSSWKGDVQKLSSGEYEDGEYVDRVSSFRAYSDVLESMRDYVKLITGNDRYRHAAKSSFDPDRYFDEIQKAGYATDPRYADKLKAISRKIAFMAYK